MNGKKSNDRKQAWISPEFELELKRLKAKKLLVNGKEVSIADITKEILNCPSFKALTEELLRESKGLTDLNIKIDKRFR